MKQLVPIIRASKVLGIPRSTIQTWVHQSILEPRVRSEPRNPHGHQLSISDLVYCLVIRTLLDLGVPVGALIDRKRRRSAQQDLERENYGVVFIWIPDIRMLARVRYEDITQYLESNPIIWVRAGDYYEKIVRRLEET